MQKQVTTRSLSIGGNQPKKSKGELAHWRNRKDRNKCEPPETQNSRKKEEAYRSACPHNRGKGQESWGHRKKKGGRASYLHHGC